jgi:RNA polymerase sigma-B factor
LWDRYEHTHDGRTRDDLIQRYAPLAHSLAMRFAHRGAEQEDVEQAAMLGLVEAVDRFHPESNHAFSSYATPTILGEIRHYFQVASWKLHVPRATRTLSMHLERASEELTGQLGRPPTSAELARVLQVPEEAVRAATPARRTRSVVSLDRVMDDRKPGGAKAPLAQEDAEMAAAELRVSMSQALMHLPAALREVIELRYLGGGTQREVASTLGISQAKVCRRESRALAALRSQFLEGGGQEH